MNNNSSVNGIVLQLPLSSKLKPDLFKILNKLDSEKVVDYIFTDKDNNKFLEESVQPESNNIDCFGYNKGRIQGMEKQVPCTVQAISQIINEYQIPCQGKKVVILGRSYLLGIPLEYFFLKKHSVVTVCDENSLDIMKHISEADILVSCTGTCIDLSLDNIKEGLIVFDMGIIISDQGKIIQGDIDCSKLIQKLSMYTPVPGGIGPLTVANLIQNLYLAYLDQNFNKQV